MSMNLAVYAARDDNSRGRRYQEEGPQPFRGEYQRDRDRILHSKAFRRLEYKTQVFVNHEGDLFRTRLTHSLEVAQISRSICRCLGLNEDLAEAIALAHDLGHTPFGHAGQDALNICMEHYGGFEHNLQSLRVVEELEQRYPGFDGLNLTFETREGILKHCPASKARQLGELGERFLENTYPSLEAQVVDLADGIAYNSHDVDDGLRAGLLSVTRLQTQALFADHYWEARKLWPNAPERRLHHETVRRMINAQVVNLIETSSARVGAMEPINIEAARNAPEALITFSAAMEEQYLNLKHFLREELYRHYRVYRMAVKARHIVQHLFDAYHRDMYLMPPEAREHARNGRRQAGAEVARAWAVADYIAGMTDRFAILEYQRLFDPITLP